MKVLHREKISPICVHPGDVLQLEFQQANKERRTVLTHKITEAAEYDVAIVVEFENGELGLRHGLGGVFGSEL